MSSEQASATTELSKDTQPQIKKGFRNAKSATKAEVAKENNQLRTNLEQLNQQVRFIGQQMFQQMQAAKQVQSELTAAINLLRLESVSEVQEGDTVMIDCLGVLTETGKTFNGGHLQGTIVKVGSKNFVTGFEEALMGMKVGDQKDIVVTFPDNYAEELKSKEAKFTTVVLKVWRASAKDGVIAALQQESAANQAAEQAAKKASETPA